MRMRNRSDRDVSPEHSTGPVVASAVSEENIMKRFAVLLVASAAVCAAPALAEEVIVKQPEVGVTVGSGPVVKEREVVREREPREKVIVKEHREPTVIEKKTVIHND